MKIVTWNVNSTKARHERLLSWLERHNPDVLCLQELKCVEENFPALEVRGLGYHFAAYGQKTYNGVAIISRHPIDEVTRGFDDGVQDPQARLITGKVEGVHIINGYFPNGGEVGSDKYVYKLAWMQRLNQWVAKHCDLETDIAICGDYNVATLDADVNRMHEWGDTAMCSPEGRQALKDLRDMGFIDAFQKHHPEGGIFSWWDYRQLGFPKNNGLRIDHIYATPSLAARSQKAYVDRDERKGKRPSDHAPVVVEFA